jgi:hypothetical protein
MVTFSFPLGGRSKWGGAYDKEINPLVLMTRVVPFEPHEYIDFEMGPILILQPTS